MRDRTDRGVRAAGTVVTVIAAAFRTTDDYAIAADSEARDENGGRIPGVEKCWRWGSVLLGSAGSWVQGQRAKRVLATMDPPTSRDELIVALETMHAALLPHVGTPGYLTRSDCGVDLLTVAPWGIAYVDSCGGVLYPGTWWAMGSGGPMARGAMWALVREEPSRDRAPAFLVSEGVYAAIDLDSGCGGGAVVLRSGTP